MLVARVNIHHSQPIPVLAVGMGNILAHVRALPDQQPRRAEAASNEHCSQAEAAAKRRRPGSWPPGAELLAIRLARCEAKPEAERGPDVASFIQSAHLLREACQLLPLAEGDGGAPAPALPAMRDTRDRTLLALACIVAASELAPPGVALSDAQPADHVLAYRPMLLRAYPLPDASAPGGLLPAVLLLCTRATPDAAGLRFAAQAADALEAPGALATAQRQLEDLAARQRRPAGPPLTAHQLQLAVLTLAAQLALLPEHWHEVVARFKAARALEARCTAQLLRRQPAQPRAAFLAAQAAAGCEACLECEPAAWQQVAALYARACTLAQQQGSLYWQARAAPLWLEAEVKSWDPAEHDLPTQQHLRRLQAAVQAFEQGEEAVRRCRRLLPAPWVQQVEALRAEEHGVLDSARKVLAAAQGEAPVVDAVVAATETGDEPHAGPILQAARCDACGQPVVGLRR
ncbi:hypothetical protein ABPG75_006115 [Micractinium tetrahymenae]